MSQVTISGAVSGLDTAGIINQLVAVQTNQQTILKTQQSAVQKRADAYSALVTSLTSLGSQANDLAKTGSWVGASATSSSTGVTATATGTATGSITFNVTAVAAAHSVVSTSTVASTNAIVASGPVTLTKDDGSVTTLAIGTGSLSDVVSSINSSGKGVIASAVRTDLGEYRLQVTSSTTGADSEFTLSGLSGFAGTDVLTQGTDAKIHVGTNPATAYDVSSRSNTFADLMPGLSFTVSKIESPVTVAAKVDGSAIADKVSKLVDTANTILSDIATKTAYDAKTRTGGPLTGESSVRALQQNILNTASGAGAPGIQLTRDGKLAFDRAAFLSAFTADPASVARSFGAATSFTPSSGAPTTTVTLTNALKSARAGTYDVDVTTLAQREKWQLDPAGGVIAGATVALTRGSTTISYTADVGDDLAAAASAMNSRSSAAGLGITAAVSGSSLVFTADSYGTAAAFTAKLNAANGTQVTVGADIQGLIDGEDAIGLGNVLSLPNGTGGAVGLSLAVNTTATAVLATGGAIGKVTYSPGLAQRLSTLVDDATASSTGAVKTAQDGANAEVKRFQGAIDAWDTRLEAYRQTLTRQFTAMETALAKLKSSTSALSGLIKSTQSDSEN